MSNRRTPRRNQLGNSNASSSNDGSLGDKSTSPKKFRCLMQRIVERDPPDVNVYEAVVDPKQRTIKKVYRYIECSLSWINCSRTAPYSATRSLMTWDISKLPSHCRHLDCYFSPHKTLPYLPVPFTPVQYPVNIHVYPCTLLNMDPYYSLQFIYCPYKLTTPLSLLRTDGYLDGEQRY